MSFSFINIEIKARPADTGFIRNYLLQHHADFRGTDLQTDTYFHVPHGRLKLRQGNIENSLIYYERPDQVSVRQSDCRMMEIQDGVVMKEILSRSLGVKVVVHKKREIYFIGNVKFHIDHIDALGDFVEIEASDKEQALPAEKLREQCNFYKEAFGIQDADLVGISYSDMLMAEMPVQ